MYRARAVNAQRLSILIGAMFLIATTGAAGIPAPDSRARSLAQLTLEDLMQLEITSVSGIAQPRITAPAALTVISADDINRSGHTSLPEVLRMVPGMHVGRLNSSSWIAGSRGLTASVVTANRYLVLIDGRAVHDPLLSTTFWDAIDVPIDAIDRIEVIRGPGATLWGANAMNGVINVITRDARDTVGTAVRAGFGNYERGFGELRHGAETASGAYRVWAKYARRGDFENAAGTSIEDQWSSLHAGMRLDHHHPAGVHYTVIGAAHTLPTSNYSVLEPVPGAHFQSERKRGHSEIDGGHLLLRATHDLGNGAGWSVQGYQDMAQRSNVRLDYRRRTSDIDFRHWFRWGDRHEWIWGLQYNHNKDSTRAGASFAFAPGSRSVDTVNAFVQNSTALIDDRLYLMLGAKFSHHDFVGGHVQPNLRLWWTPDASQILWAAISRPLRVPSRLEVDGQLIFAYVDTGLLSGQAASGVIVPLSLSGNPRLDVEQLTAWEIGYRLQFGDHWALEATGFAGDHDHLVSVPPEVIGSFNQLGSSTTLAADVTLSYRASSALRLESSYSWLRTRVDGPVLQVEEGGTPRYAAQLRAYWDISSEWQLNGAIYRVGDIPGQSIDGYTRADLGLVWKPTSRIEVSLWGQNLTDPSHPEASAAEVPRSIYAQVSVELR